MFLPYQRKWIQYGCAHAEQATSVARPQIAKDVSMMVDPDRVMIQGQRASLQVAYHRRERLVTTAPDWRARPPDGVVRISGWLLVGAANIAGEIRIRDIKKPHAAFMAAVKLTG